MTGIEQMLGALNPRHSEGYTYSFDGGVRVGLRQGRAGDAGWLFLLCPRFFILKVTTDGSRGTAVEAAKAQLIMDLCDGFHDLDKIHDEAVDTTDDVTSENVKKALNEFRTGRARHVRPPQGKSSYVFSTQPQPPLLDSYVQSKYRRASSKTVLRGV